MSLSTTTLSAHRLSVWSQIAILCGVTLLLFVGQFLIPIEYLVALAILVFLGVTFLRSESVIVAAFSAIVIIVKLQERDPAEGMSLLDILAGILICGAVLYLVYRKLFRREPIAPHPAVYPAYLFALWATIGGALSVVQGITTPVSVLREFLLYSPLIVLPALFCSAAEHDRLFERRYFYLLLGLGAIVLMASIVRVRSTMAAATYLYQTGFSVSDVISGAFVIFLFFALASVETDRKRRWLYLLGMLGGAASLLLTFNRTSWAATAVCLPMLVLSFRGIQRTTASKLLLRLVIAMGLIMTVLYFTMPIAQLMLKYFYGRLITTSNVRTDISLVNRYIEWRYVLRQILETPILGVGFGGKYSLYSWIPGFTFASGYSHNGVMVILLKGGIVGFLLFATTYVWCIFIGVRLSLSDRLSKLDSTLVRVGLVTIFYISIESLTSGLILHREMLFYLAFIWSFFFVTERRYRLAAAAGTPPIALPAGSHDN